MKKFNLTHKNCPKSYLYSNLYQPKKRQNVNTSRLALTRVPAAATFTHFKTDN